MHWLWWSAITKYLYKKGIAVEKKTKETIPFWLAVAISFAAAAPGHVPG